MPLLIRSFDPRDQGAARQLILAGLGEHFGWIDVELVGTEALTTEDENTGRIVRMSVKQTHRRKGIGRALVTHLLNVACQKGFTQVRVSTEHDWEEVIGLYELCGFSECSRDDVSIYFSLALET